jgi:imidazole glycerol phosphate synthase subunit HisF
MIRRASCCIAKKCLDDVRSSKFKGHNRLGRMLSVGQVYGSSGLDEMVILSGARAEMGSTAVVGEYIKGLK